MPNDPPDNLARVIAIFGIVMSAATSLYVTHLNHQFQKRADQEKKEQGIIAHLVAARYPSPSRKNTVSPDGELGVEIVNKTHNIIYIKAVRAKFEGRDAVFYSYDGLSPNTMPRLDYAETKSYKIPWKFPEGLALFPSPFQELGVVEVFTSISDKPLVQVAAVPFSTVSSTVPLQPRAVRRKKK